MNQTKPIISDKSFFIQYAVEIDFATFLGSGLLATSYLTTWINDPLSKAGVVFAALLNATILGIGSNIAKTEESESLLYKGAIIVGCLVLSSVMASYAAIPLESQFGVVLSLKSSMQIAGINLAAKIGTYARYLLGTKTMDSSLLCQLKLMK